MTDQPQQYWFNRRVYQIIKHAWNTADGLIDFDNFDADDNYYYYMMAAYDILTGCEQSVTVYTASTQEGLRTELKRSVDAARKIETMKMFNESDCRDLFAPFWR